MKKFISNIRQKWHDWEQERIELVFFDFIHIETNNFSVQKILLVLIRVSTALIIINEFKKL